MLASVQMPVLGILGFQTLLEVSSVTMFLPVLMVVLPMYLCLLRGLLFRMLGSVCLGALGTSETRETGSRHRPLPRLADGLVLWLRI